MLIFHLVPLHGSPGFKPNRLCDLDYLWTGHMLIGMKPNIALSDLMRDVKSDSTEFIKRKGWIRGRFNWQEGFGAFSYSHSHLDSVIRYIRNQEKHHAKKSFRNEYLTLLKKFDIAYEPKYLFEFFTDE